MLVLSRKPGQSLRIGDNVRLLIVRIDKDRVRVGIEAPRDVRIARGELDSLLISTGGGEAPGTASTKPNSS